MHWDRKLSSKRATTTLHAPLMCRSSTFMSSRSQVKNHKTKELLKHCNSHTVLLLSNSTNNELVKLLMSDDSLIKRKLYNNNLKDYLLANYTQVSDYSIINECKYYSVETYVDNICDINSNPPWDTTWYMSIPGALTNTSMNLLWTL